MATNLALMGRARSGKDTIAARLVKAHGYTRIAFADPLKEMALKANPLIRTTSGIHVRLDTLIHDVGWEYAKDRYSEVRRFLQALGQSARDLDRDFWANMAMDAIADTQGPVVVTDVRYPNEAAALSARGFRLVRVIRPTLAQRFAKLHESETALDDHLPHLLLANAGSLSELRLRADALVV